MHSLTFVFLLAFCGQAFSARDADLITNLPGLAELPKFKQYSGHLDVSATKHLHYWFVESQNDPQSDPVVLWLNGGPGCSSLDGLLSENGPIHVNDDGNTLYMNPYSWNKLANVLYLESPAGVGYSYDDNGNVNTDDDQVATYNLAALQNFFKGFPEFSKNEFYITGESYGGIYIPTLTVQVLRHASSINLKGIAVGNGLSSFSINDNSLVFFAYYHGLVGETDWNNLAGSCCKGGVSRTNCSFSPSNSPDCSSAVKKVFNTVYSSGLNEYALYLDCSGAQAAKSYQFAMRNLFRNLDNSFRSGLLSSPPKQPHEFSSRLKDVPPCINSTAETNWLNSPGVRKALHIPKMLPKWSVCSDAVELAYERKYEDMVAQYKEILSHPTLRILIYNGDTDMACNFLGDQWFFDNLKLQPVKSHQPWYLQGQVAGFAREYKQVQFTTIRGAGHMVPQWAPSYAYAMMEKFLNDHPLIDNVPK